MKKRISACLSCALVAALAVFLALSAYAVTPGKLGSGTLLQPGEAINIPGRAGSFYYRVLPGWYGVLPQTVSGKLSPRDTYKLPTPESLGLVINEEKQFSGWLCSVSGSTITIEAQYTDRPVITLTRASVSYGITVEPAQVYTGDTVTITVPEEYADFIDAITVTGAELIEDENGRHFTVGNENITVDTQVFGSSCLVFWDTAGGTRTDNGSERQLVEIDEGYVEITTPAAPQRKYYIFTGWEWDGTVYPTGESIQALPSAFSLITFTAQWEPDPATAVNISLDKCDGTDPSSLASAPGDGVILPAARRPGYSFRGWSTKAGGNGTVYQAGDRFVPKKDCTLYAVWSEAVCTVNISVKHLGSAVGDLTGAVLTDVDGVEIAGTSDGGGVFTFSNVPDGEYTLTLYSSGARGCSGTVTVEGDRVTGATLKIEMRDE